MGAFATLGKLDGLTNTLGTAANAFDNNLATACVQTAQNVFLQVQYLAAGQPVVFADEEEEKEYKPGSAPVDPVPPAPARRDVDTSLRPSGPTN